MRLLTIGVAAMVAAGCGDDAARTAPTASGSDGTGAMGGGGGGAGASGSGGAPSCEGSHPEDPRVALALATLRDFAKQHGIPGGGALAVVQAGEILGVGGFGTKAEPGCDPVTEDTLFRVTKATELITTLAALDAVEEGKLSLSGPIENVVPTLHVDNDEHGPVSQITLRHLLAETSGYRAISDQWMAYNSCTTLADSVSNADIPLLYFPPGTMQQPGTWSNTEIAGLALQIVDGVPYEDAVRARVLDPLEMGGAFHEDDIEAADHALGHYPPGAVPASLEICPNRYPSDGYYGSIRDMAKLLACLTGGQGDVLDPSMLDAMLSPQGPMFWSSDYMPFGFDDAWHDPTIDDDVLQIDSSRGGYYQFTVMLKGRRLAIMVLLNGDPFNVVSYVEEWTPMIEGIFAAFDPTLEELDLYPSFTADPTLVESVVGTYVDPIGFNGDGMRTIEVSVNAQEPTDLDGVLTATDGSRQSIKLTPAIAPDNFNMVGEIWQNVRFWRDDNGFAYAMSFGADGGPPFYREP